MNISDPVFRSVLEDQDLASGHRPTKWGIALELIAVAADDGDAVAVAVAAAVAADAGDAATAVVAGADAADAVADDVVVDDAADAACDAKSINQNLILLLTGEDMRTGLTVLQVTGAYYGYAVTLVGWMRRVGGDEYELMPGHVTVLRKGERHPNGLDRLAAHGPGDDYSCSEPAEMVEQLHRLLVRRPKPCNEKAWKKIVPRPHGWVDE